ncbi:MAG: DNA topoisomerase VI subunit B, partial [Candidatus Micrarchaeota archaeon]
MADADEIFEEFKEHSVAEFFKKNRQMLGFSGKVRSLTTIVHEYVTNSVSWETPTVVKINGRVFVKPIGGVIDGHMKNSPTEHSPDNEIESLRKFEAFEVLCFDSESLKLKFKEVKAIHRHPMKPDERVYKIKLVGGRTVESTAHHGLFTLKNGKVSAVRAEELNVGDFLVAPRKSWRADAISELNLIEEALSLSDEEIKEFGVYGIRDILFADKRLMEKIKSQFDYRGRHYYFYNRYMKCDRLPIRLLRVLTQEERAVFYKCEVGARHSKYRLSAVLPITEELLCFLGLYAAEGNTRESLIGVSLSFGSHENELIEYALGLSKSLFGCAFKNKAHNTATNINIPNATLAFLLQKILKCGRRATSKRVPWLAFNVSKELAEAFLLAYLAGDGYPSREIFEYMARGTDLKGKITAATSNPELALGLQYLLSSLGYSYSYSKVAAETRIVAGKTANFKKSFRIEFYPDQRNSPLSFYPIEIGGISAVVEPALKWAINTRGQETVSIEKVASLAIKGANVSPEAVAFCNGDLGVLQISEIETRGPREGEHVYDYSIEGDENFVGGFGAICLHNSLDACEEAGILPNILIKVDQLENEHYKVTAEDNGPGIPRAHLGKALGMMLAGTKFHRYMQQRGQQGIGASGATMFSQMTTGKPIKVRTGLGNGRVFECELAMDVKSNKPIIANEKEYMSNYRGLVVEAEFAEVKYDRSDHGVFEYMKRTAIANPHAQLTLIEPTGERIVFPRASEKIPARPREVQPHPLGITTNDLMEMAQHSKQRKVSSFLTTTFSRLSSAKVEELRQLVPNVNFDKQPFELKWEEAEALVRAFQNTKWI